MTWDDRLCLGRAPDCEGYRGAPCDCFGPWTDTELAEAQSLLAETLAAMDAPPEPPAPLTPNQARAVDVIAEYLSGAPGPFDAGRTRQAEGLLERLADSGLLLISDADDSHPDTPP